MPVVIQPIALMPNPDVPGQIAFVRLDNVPTAVDVSSGAVTKLLVQTEIAGRFTDADLVQARDKAKARHVQIHPPPNAKYLTLHARQVHPILWALMRLLIAKGIFTRAEIETTVLSELEKRKAG